MTGVFNWFNISDMKSAIIDLEWMKVCANLTVLPSGALTMHAMVKRVAPFSSATVASLVALEYPANNYTEVWFILILKKVVAFHFQILINKKQKFSDVQAHFRPLDRSITSGPPCGEQNLGGVTKLPWVEELKKNFMSHENDSSVIFDERFVTGVTSMLGTSILLKEGKDVFCGHFEPPSERTVAFAELGHPFDGYIKMVSSIVYHEKKYFFLIISKKVFLKNNCTHLQAFEWQFQKCCSNFFIKTPLTRYSNCKVKNFQTQYTKSNWESGFPTEIYYSLKYMNQIDPTVNPVCYFFLKIIMGFRVRLSLFFRFFATKNGKKGWKCTWIPS